MNDGCSLYTYYRYQMILWG